MIRKLQFVAFSIFSINLSCSKDKTASMSGSVGVVQNVEAGAPLAVDPTTTSFKLSEAPPNYNEKVSFNPTSLSITITGLQLCRVGNEGYDENGNYGCADTKNSVKLEGQKEIEFIGQAGLASLGDFGDGQIEEAQFGDYAMAMVGMSTFITYSGNATIGGSSHKLERIEYPSGNGISVKLPTSIRVDDKNSHNFRVYFDVHAPTYLFNSLTGSGSPGSIAVEGTVSTRLANMSLLAYAGEGKPTIESYNVVLDTDTFGTKAGYQIRVSVLMDNTGKFYTATWHAEFLAGFQESGDTPFELCDIDGQRSMANADGSYLLGSHEAADWCSEAFGVGKISAVKFPAFKFATHTGTVVIGKTEFNYTATKN